MGRWRSIRNNGALLAIYRSWGGDGAGGDGGGGYGGGEKAEARRERKKTKERFVESLGLFENFPQI